MKEFAVRCFQDFVCNRLSLREGGILFGKARGPLCLATTAALGRGGRGAGGLCIIYMFMISYASRGTAICRKSGMEKCH